MSREDIVRFIKTFNSTLDIEFIESLSRVELNGYVSHLKAIREKTRRDARRTPAKAGKK
jgi:hypothetical protein